MSYHFENIKQPTAKRYYDEACYKCAMDNCQSVGVMAWMTMENMGEAIDDLEAECAELESDRDHYKSRVEALERAVRNKCEYCANAVPEFEDCRYCEAWLQGPGKQLWKFDYERFAGMEVGDE